MIGKFMLSADTPQETLDWGKLKWMSNPPATGAGQLTVIEVSLAPGHGHDFHKHPDQEEVIYCVAGKVEQWLGEQKREMGPGDSIFICADVVHATFNIGDQDATLLAILGPCVGEMGYEIEEVADTAPWNTLR